MTEKLTQASPKDSDKTASKLRNTIVKNVLKIAFAVGLIYWMVREGALDLDTFSKIATPGLVVFCATCVFLQIYFNNFRWMALLRGQEFKTSVAKTLPLSFIGMFFNFAMPGGVGGDVVKGYYLLQDYPHKKFAGALTIFMDRLMGFFVMIGTAFIAIFFNWSKVDHSPELKSVAVGVALLFAAFLTFFFLSLSKVLQNAHINRIIFEKLPGGRKIRVVYDALHSYRKSPRALIAAALLSCVNQFLVVALVVAIARAMNVTTIPLSVFFFLVPVGTVVQALPIAPAGIGVGQAAFFFLFKFYLGEESQLGPTAATFAQLLSFAWGLLGAFFYLRRKNPESFATDDSN
jgi:uncharacterized protein (TIRG00374 family)